MLTKKRNTNLRWMAVCAILMVLLLLAACGAPAAAPTATPIPPTLVPPTATPVPPTPTPVPPTATPIPPTVTPEPPTATPIPPTTTPASKPTAAPKGKGRIEKGEITSLALADNLIGDPATRPYHVYLPPGYDVSNQRYPVVYYLPGGTGRANQGLYFMPDLVDSLISRDLREMIVVSVDGWTSFDGSWYRNSPVFGDFETYIVKELVQHIDDTYRTISHRESRGIVGYSMGGEGAIHLGFSYPEVFGVVASLNGPFDFHNDVMLAPGLEGFRSDPKSFMELRLLHGRTQAYFAWAAINAPNPNNTPFFVEKPFRLVDGKAEVVPEVWDKLSTAGVLHEIDQYMSQPVRLQGILLANGKNDTLVPIDLAQAFDSALTEQGIEHEFQTHPGGHTDFEMAPLLRYMSDNLVF